jgi:acyl dehydratase
MSGLYWEEWDIGREWTTAGRTMTETDIVIFSGLSGDYNRLHTDEEFCKTAGFGTRVAHGTLGYVFASGLVFQLHLYDDTIIAFLGWDNLRFLGPIKMGDTIHAKITVMERRETSKPDRGILKRKMEIINQRGEVVQEGVQAFMIKRKPK